LAAVTQPMVTGVAAKARAAGQQRLHLVGP